MLDDPSRRVVTQAHKTLLELARRLHGVKPDVRPSRSSWKRWDARLQDELKQMKKADNLIEEAKTLIAERKRYDRADRLVKEAESILDKLGRAPIVTSKRSIERKLKTLGLLKYQAFKTRTIFE